MITLSLLAPPGYIVERLNALVLSTSRRKLTVLKWQPSAFSNRVNACDAISRTLVIPLKETKRSLKDIKLFPFFGGSGSFSQVALPSTFVDEKFGSVCDSESGLG